MSPELVEWILDMLGVADVATLEQLREDDWSPFGCGCCTEFPQAREGWMDDEDADTYNVVPGWVSVERDGEDRIKWIGDDNAE